MLTIHIDELEALRTKLLSAVLYGSLQDEDAARAVACADLLKDIAVAIENSGSTFVYSSPHALGDLLADAIRDLQSGSAQLN